LLISTSDIKRDAAVHYWERSMLKQYIIRYITISSRNR